MLPRENRLVSKYEFNKVRYLANKGGTKASGKLFHIFYIIPKGYNGKSKFGIVVSNKFAKSAVVRNKVKRLFREAIRENLSNFTDGYWVVIHPKFSCTNSTYEEIRTDFNKILQKIPISR